MNGHGPVWIKLQLFPLTVTFHYYAASKHEVRKGISSNLPLTWAETLLSVLCYVLLLEL
ncbi:hypothetical protein D3C77_274570 [compost metagenome]